MKHFILQRKYVTHRGVPILKLAKDNPKKELKFEVNFQLSLTTRERFEMMFGKDAMKFLKFARKHERFKTPFIIKRA